MTTYVRRLTDKYKRPPASVQFPIALARRAARTSKRFTLVRRRSTDAACHRRSNRTPHHASPTRRTATSQHLVFFNWITFLISLV
jgi:hypothetical protein